MAEPVKPASVFVPVTGFNTTLTDTLSRTATVLPVAIPPSLRNKLTAESFTYLTISNHVDMEVVKAYLFDGKLLIERGFDDTQATAFPKGSCVTSVPTWAGIKELICTYDCCKGD